MMSAKNQQRTVSIGDQALDEKSMRRWTLCSKKSLDQLSTSLDLDAPPDFHAMIQPPMPHQVA
jgi:hypothetical protein